ncbi:o-succinylbenzoate--CoA ligase [Bacillus sp. 2205SS5-2]|uniref:o-succinylbenzoate--CoA ligase n=1 Tax=Bacillus sp. 2205SS5-2 TaxID=3109031 RepID=UPI003004B03E
MNIPNLLLQRAHLTPDRIGLFGIEKNYTFQELFAQSLIVAGRLRRLGVKSGDHVGVLSSNDEKMVILLHSLQQLGCVSVLLNTRLTAEELSFQLRDANVEVICTEAAFANRCSFINKDSIYTITDLFSNEGEEFEPEKELILEDICSIMFTSGTTGKPKGVLQSYQNHWWSAMGSVLNLGLDENDCWLCAVPLFHISGFSILMRSVIYGIPMKIYREFNAKEINLDIEAGNGTIISVVATMTLRLLEDLGNRKYHPRFRCFLLGGGPASLLLLQKCMKADIPVFQTYGMTETCSQVVTLPPEYSLTKLGSAGKALFPCQLTILDPNEQGEGEIAVKGPNISSGYYRRLEATQDAFREGWLLTGDIGYLDEEGFLFVVDRRSDLIISGGENIYPAEVESVLQAHEAVIEAGVTKIPNDKWGQVPYAYITVRQVVGEEELLRWCEERLAKYKVPHGISIVKELPRNAANKLVRNELRALWERR